MSAWVLIQGTTALGSTEGKLKTKNFQCRKKIDTQEESKPSLGLQWHSTLIIK